MVSRAAARAGTNAPSTAITTPRHGEQRELRQVPDVLHPGREVHRSDVVDQHPVRDRPKRDAEQSGQQTEP
ncbi:hypothetical protein KCMC57_up07050 [Kitasatospora sp. CMC57]|uniref:Uncharacterized protein n=2 Tax=Kitasatospora sp. CMC57 TaxID=3231513 RepID=A0AB33JX71_9ACTN